MKRRQFISLLGGAAAAASPLAARAQQRMRRVGVLMAGGESDPEMLVRVAAFRETFEKLGWIEGRNVRIDLRFGNANSERIRTEAKALLGQSPDAILANGTPVLQVMRELARSVPIVFVGVSDPVSAGFVPTLTRPGGNITGFSNFEYAIGGKWLEILTEAAPTTKRVAVLMDRDDPARERYLAPIEKLAPSSGVQVTRVFLDDAVEIERALAAVASEPNGGLIVINTPRAMAQRELISTLAARHRLPAIYPARAYVIGGGLMSYGIDPADPYRGAASYIDRILKGEKPAEMPVQLPTKFEFIVNLKAAKALGLTLPLPLIGRTDEVIE